MTATHSHLAGVYMLHVQNCMQHGTSVLDGPQALLNHVSTPLPATQARVKWFAMTFSSYCAASAWAATAQGMPCSHAVWRYVRVATIAITIAAAAELHARQVFLALAGRGAVTTQGVGCARAGGAKKHV